MQSRMEKYQTSGQKKYERTRKNTQLYESVYDDMYRDTTYRNMEVIDSAKEININKLKNMIDDKKYDTRRYRTLTNYDYDEEDDDKKPIFNSRQKVYDINQIINDAKSKRAFIEETKEKKKYSNFTQRYNKRYDGYEDDLKEEKELEELINTMAMPKLDENANDALDMFSDLKGNDNTVVTDPINSNLSSTTITKDIDELTKADRTFYTNSNMFTKNDFEDFGDLKNELNKKGKLKSIITTIIIASLLVALGCFIYFKFVK